MKKIIVAVAALALMASSAYAADWNFYGSARVSTFWSDADVDGGEDKDTQYDQGLQGNARIGANVKVSDELTGRFEYGADGDGETANVRHLYGEWDFGAGKLLVGKTYVPMYLPGSNQVYWDDAALEGFGGEMYGSRKAQIKLTFGDFQIAVVENNTKYVTGDYDNYVTYVIDGDDLAEDETLISDAVKDDVDVVIPMIQVQYALTIDNFVITMAGGYQTFDVENDDVDDDITSYALGLDVAATFGAFTITAQVNGGTNVGNLQSIDVLRLGDEDESSLFGDAGAGYAMLGESEEYGSEIIDNDALGFRIVLGYTFNEMFAVEVGYGYQQTEYDYSGFEEIEAESYYINFPITLAPGVYVIPEVGVVDYSKDDYEGQEDITYFGAKWQINF